MPKQAMQQPWASCVDSIQPPASPCNAAGAVESGRLPPSCSDTTATHTHGSSRRWSKVCSFLVLLHAFQITCGSVAGASAAATSPPPMQTAPCVECNDCVTSSCLRICMLSCKTASSMAEGSELSVEQCKHKGQEGALDIATAACKLAQVRLDEVWWCVLCSVCLRVGLVASSWIGQLGARPSSTSTTAWPEFISPSSSTAYTVLYHQQANCQVSPKAPMTFQSVGTVSGSQCAALANAGCQKMASAPTYSPCGANQYFGHRTCSGRQFSDIYRVKVGQLCLAAMHALG